MATQPTEDSSFDDAFAQFAGKAEDKPAEEVVVEEKPAEEAPVAEEKPAEEKPAEEAPVVEEKPAEEAPAAVEEKPVEESVSQADTDDVLARLTELVKNAPAAEEKPVEEKPVEEKPEELPELYSAEDVEFLKEYDKDWSDVVRGEALKRKAEYRDLLQHVFGEVAKHLGPIADMVNELATRTHLGDLQERVPDYNDLRDKVVTWVETQPAYLQIGMKEVMKTGTADEVADLIERFRKETGQVPVTEQKKVELSDDAKKAAQTLAPVDTKRSVIPQNDDPNDFDGAFAKFAGGNNR